MEKMKKKMAKKLKKETKKRSDYTMSNTTKSILKQNRTNPHANVMLSGKKKRKLLKEARRMVQEGLAMEVIDVCQWRVSIGLWYCHLHTSSRSPPNTKDSPITHRLRTIIQSRTSSGEGDESANSEAININEEKEPPHSEPSNKLSLYYREPVEYGRPPLHRLIHILDEIAHHYPDIGTALNRIPHLRLHPLPQFNLRRMFQWWKDSVGSPMAWDDIINAIRGFFNRVADHNQLNFIATGDDTSSYVLLKFLSQLYWAISDVHVQDVTEVLHAEEGLISHAITDAQGVDTNVKAINLVHALDTQLDITTPLPLIKSTNDDQQPIISKIGEDESIRRKSVHHSLSYGTVTDEDTSSSHVDYKSYQPSLNDSSDNIPNPLAQLPVNDLPVGGRSDKSLHYMLHQCPVKMELDCQCVLVVLMLLLLLSGDVELNPGPKTDITPQLTPLMNILSEIAPQYSLIGTALYVPMNTLGLGPQTGSHRENLRITLQWWLDNGPTVGSPVTYDNIINAIKGPIVDNFRVSEKLREFYEQQLLEENQLVPSESSKHKQTHELPIPPPLKRSKLSSVSDDQPTTSLLGKHKSSERQSVPLKSINLSYEPDITDEGPSTTTDTQSSNLHHQPKNIELTTNKPLTTDGPSDTSGPSATDGPLSTNKPSIPNPPSVYCPPMRDIKSNPTPYTPDLVKDVNVILVTAIEVEFRAVMGQAKPLGDHNEFDQVSYDGTVTFYLGMYGKYKVAIIQTAQGGRNTREVLGKVQEGVKAEYVIAVGICYGMKEDKVKLGDVIVAKHIMDLTDHRANPDGSLAARPVGDWAGKHLYNILKESAGFGLKSGDGPDDYVDIKTDGVLVSETTLVASQEYKDQILRQIPQALGGEMEGAAIMELVDAGKFEGIVIKGVADYGNENKQLYVNWKIFAAVASAKYILYHLERTILKGATESNLVQSSSTDHDEILLKKPDFRELFEKLNSIRDNWQLIGYALNVNHHIINGLKASETNDMSRLIGILNAWFYEDESVTWKTIIDAVGGNIVKNNKLANEIRDLVITHYTEHFEKAADKEKEPDDDDDDEDEVDKEFEAKIHLNIENDGSLNVSVLKVILYGPPNVGKTTLMKRLIEELVNLKSKREFSSSTGIDPPITVPVYTECVSVLVDEWKRHDLDSMLQICLSLLSKSSESQTLLNEVSEDQVSQSLSNNLFQNEIKSDEPNVTVKTVQHVDLRPVTSSTAVTSSNTSNPDLSSLIKDLIATRNFKEMGKQLKEKGIEDATLLQIIDVGGQPEFHEIFPQILDGHAMYMLFFNLSKELDEPYEVAFRNEDKSFSDEYKSQLTVKEMLDQILSSIELLSGQERSAAILIGTYLDEYKRIHGDDKTDKEAVWKDVEARLKMFFKNKGYKRDVLRQHGGHILFPIDNESGTLDDEIKPLREFIKKTVQYMRPEATLPTTWALFYYQLLNFPKTNKKEFCTLDEAKMLAKGVNIKEEDVGGILKHFHKRFGSVLYYDDILCDDGMTKLVFCSPNVLLKAICEFVKASFGSESLLPQATEELRNTGLISHEDFNHLCQVSQRQFKHQIPNTFIVNLLIKRNIISQVQTEQDLAMVKYFIPCLLKARTQTDPAPSPPCPDVAPLLLKGFRNDNTKCIPPGFISAIFVELSKNSGWELNLEEECYKNEVTFIYKGGPHVMLIAQRDALEVRVQHCHKNYIYLCQEVLSHINDAIDDIKKIENKLKDYVKSLSLKEGFYCPESHHAKKINNDEMRCAECKKTFSLSMEKYQVWYGKEFLSTITGQEVPTGATASNLVKSSLTDEEILLRKPNFDELLEKLSTISDKWKLIGYALNVDRHIIKGLKTNEPDDISRLCEVLEAWFDKDESVTWKTIIDAVEGSYVNNKAVANNIRKFLSKTK